MFDPDSMMNFLDILRNSECIRGETIGNDTFTNGPYTITIDTCFTRDTNRYETAIIVNRGEIVVVEDYDNSDDAAIGHSSWINACKQ